MAPNINAWTVAMMKWYNQYQDSGKCQGRKKGCCQEGVVRFPRHFVLINRFPSLLNWNELPSNVDDLVKTSNQKVL